MDAPLPGIEPWDEIVRNRALAHFSFAGPDAEQLVQGRERIYLDRIWNDFAGDPAKVDEATRAAYAAQYALPGAMRAGFAQFAAFPQDAEDNRIFQRTRLSMPLAVGGEKSFGATMAAVMRNVATDVHEAIVPGAGHWLMEESPEFTVALIRDFLAGRTPAEQRLSITEFKFPEHSEAGAGTSGVSGIQTVVLKGDPARAGLYTIMLRIPANTRIAAHEHMDDRGDRRLRQPNAFRRYSGRTGYRPDNRCRTVFDALRRHRVGPAPRVRRAVAPTVRFASDNAAPRSASAAPRRPLLNLEQALDYPTYIVPGEALMPPLARPDCFQCLPDWGKRLMTSAIPHWVNSLNTTSNLFSAVYRSPNLAAGVPGVGWSVIIMLTPLSANFVTLPALNPRSPLDPEGLTAVAGVSCHSGLNGVSRAASHSNMTVGSCAAFHAGGDECSASRVDAR